MAIRFPDLFGDRSCWLQVCAMPACQLLLAVTLLGAPIAGSGEVWADAFKAGTARVVITPPIGHLLAGYGRGRAATGLHDDLFAKALVVSDNHLQLALVTLDNIGLTRPDIEAIAADVAATVPGFKAEQVIVSSTHTHAGPDVVGIWGESFWRSGRDPAYMAALRSRVVDAVVKAAANQVLVSSNVASADSRFPWVENRSEPELLDSTMAVLQFVDEAGQSVATLTNFACHPTVLDGDNTLVSSDYVSGFYQGMAAQLEGEHLFLQGAIGGWVQPLQGDHSIELARELGAEVAERSLQLLAGAAPNPWQPIQLRSKSFDVELENWGFRLMMWLGVLERETYAGAMRTQAAWFQLGDAQFVTHPGETSPAYSLQSRALMNARHGFVLGLTQDAMGYILKPEYFSDEVTYPLGEYLTSVSVGPDAGPLLMATLAELLESR